MVHCKWCLTTINEKDFCCSEHNFLYRKLLELRAIELKKTGSTLLTKYEQEMENVAEGGK